MNSWRAYKKYWYWPGFTLAPAKHEQLAKKARNWNARSKANIWKREQNIHWVLANRSSLWSLWLLAGKTTKLKEHSHSHRQGHKQLWGAFHMGNLLCTGTSVAFLDCKRKGHSHRHTSKAFKAFRPGSHYSQWLLLKSYKIYKTAVSLWENRSDLVEIFTEMHKLLTFTWNSLKCSHSHRKLLRILGTTHEQAE